MTNEPQAGQRKSDRELAVTIALRPDVGPQIWYTDGHFAHRLDDDDIDNVADVEPSIRDIALMRAALELATHNVIRLEHDYWAAQARESARPAPMPFPQRGVYREAFQ